MRSPLICLLALLLLCEPEQGLSSRILALLPTHARSHFIFCHSILSGLAQRGHEVTIYSPFTPQSQHDNITYVQVKTEDANMHEQITYELLVNVMRLQFIGMTLALYGYYSTSESFLKSSEIQALLSSDDKYDLVVTEGSRGQESMLVFGSKFQAPNVVVWTTGAAATLNSYTGNSLSVAHIPDYFSYAATDQMTFIERTKNFVSTAWILLYYNWIHLPLQQRLLAHYAQELSSPPVSQLVSEVSLTLLNSHPTLALPHPYTPNMVPVGGAHLDLIKQPLPQNIAEWMDSAEDGVIYFSLGSVIPDHSLPQQLIQVFVNVFQRLPQKVLWKISADKLPKLPDNVLAVKWLPQQSILNHPATRLFITHGGLHSVFEAWDAGVPVVGMPVGSDQPYNMRQCVRLGVGVTIDIVSLTEHSFSTAINTVLSNHSYKKNALRVSELFHNVALPPRDTAVYWIEYVIRHAGAPHLRPHAAKCPLYQRALLDVIFAALLCVSILYVSVCKLTCPTVRNRKNLKVQ